MPLSYQSIEQTINRLTNYLINQLEKKEVTKAANLPFKELIDAVGEINSIEKDNDNNIKPDEEPELILDNITLFNESLYKRVRYYMKLLAYYLVLKGVPEYRIGQCNSLVELIALIDEIKLIQKSYLTITPITEPQYYGVAIPIEYTLKDKDGNDIREGEITIESDGVLYDSITAGQPLQFSPLKISDLENEEYQPQIIQIQYNGSNNYAPTAATEIEIIVLPSKINIDIEMTNISNNRYQNSNDIGYIGDLWEINVHAYNYNREPLSDIPFAYTIDGEEKDGITDELGNYSITQSINQPGAQLITYTTIFENEEEMSNSSKDYNINIKYNPLYQESNEYIEYAGLSYSYEVILQNEDTGVKNDTGYDGEKISIFLNGEQNDTITIENGKAILNTSGLPIGENIVEWVLYDNGDIIRTNTNITILSNFSLPEQDNYYLNSTPDIIYAPLGQIESNKTVKCNLSYEKTITEEVITGTDSNGDPIISTIVTTTTEEEDIILSTDENGILFGLLAYKEPTKYTLKLTSSSDNLNETIIYEYELKIPFEIIQLDYIRNQYAKYRFTIYDKNNYTGLSSFTMVNENGTDIIQNGLYIISLDQENSDSRIIEITYNLLPSVIGKNTVTLTINGYSESVDFILADEDFSLLIDEVEVGEGQIQIQSLSSTDNIEIISDSIQVINISNNNNIFTVDAIFKKAGNIDFNILTIDGRSQTLTITVDKAELLPYVDLDIIQYEITGYDDENNPIYSPIVRDESDPIEIAIEDIENCNIYFNISKQIYNNLLITYLIDDSIINSITYSTTGEIDGEMNIPSDILPGAHELKVVFNGDSEYLGFEKSINFSIGKIEPTLEVNCNVESRDIDCGTLTLSYEDLNDTIRLNALLTDSNSTPLSNKTIQFWVNEQLIGQSITDENGECSFSYNILENINNLYIRCSTQNQVSNLIYIHVYDTLELNVDKNGMLSYTTSYESLSLFIDENGNFLASFDDEIDNLHFYIDDNGNIMMEDKYGE